MMYRIFTENKSVKKAAKLASSYFDGFTIISGKGVIGYWKGNPESALIIEIAATKERNKVMALAEGLRIMFKQESVMVQEIDSNERFLY